jgi:LmbE family N-acetylglucosaminyl deacetylase
LNPYSGHRDHRHAGRLALDAVYPYARDRMHFPELLAEGWEPHKVREVYLMGHAESDVVIEITETMDRKLEALRCHASQLRDFAGVEGRVRERAADLGKPHGYTYAEAFRSIDLPR